MKKKLFSLLVLLMTAVSGAWAQQKYNVTFSGFDNASCNTTFTDVTLPYSKSFGKTDACSGAYDIDGSSNNEQLVGASFGDNFTITVKSAFEGTVTVRVGGETDLFDPYSRNITVACVPAAPPFDYTFSVADCEHGSGTVKFFVDEKEVKGAYQADEGKTVTMTVTPDEGYVVGSVSANAYTTWAGARRKAPAAIPMLGNVTLALVEGKANTWTFTMPAASVELKVGYLATSNLFLSEDALKDKASIAVTAGKTTVEFDDKGKSTTTVIEGNTVTTKYNGTKKILGMKVAKKTAPKLLNFSPMGQIFYYYEGETWGEAIRNHPENAANGWSIVEFGITVTYNGRALCDNAHDDDITKDTVVNPNGGYMWGPEP